MPHAKTPEAFSRVVIDAQLEDVYWNQRVHEELWTRELQPVFEKEMDLVKEGNYEFVTLFANYLPNLLYLSQNWTINQLPIVFMKESRLRWLYAMQGYT